MARGIDARGREDERRGMGDAGQRRKCCGGETTVDVHAPPRGRGPGRVRATSTIDADATIQRLAIAAGQCRKVARQSGCASGALRCRGTCAGRRARIVETARAGAHGQAAREGLRGLHVRDLRRSLNRRDRRDSSLSTRRHAEWTVRKHLVRDRTGPRRSSQPRNPGRGRRSRSTGRYVIDDIYHRTTPQPVIRDRHALR